MDKKKDKIPHNHKIISHFDKDGLTGIIAMGCPALARALGYHRNTVYGWVGVNNYYEDDHRIVFSIDRQDIKKGLPRNKRHDFVRLKEGTGQVVPVTISSQKVQSATVKTKTLGGDKGGKGGSQSSDHERVPVPPSPPATSLKGDPKIKELNKPPVEILFDPIVKSPQVTPDEPIDLNLDSVTHRDTGKKVQPKKEVNPMARLQGESHAEWAKRISGDPNIKTGINY